MANTFSLSPEELLAFKRAKEQDAAASIGDFSLATTPQLLAQSKAYSNSLDPMKGGGFDMSPIGMDPAVQSNVGTQGILGSKLAEEEAHFRMAGDALMAQAQVEAAKRQAAAQRSAAKSKAQGSKTGAIIGAVGSVGAAVVGGLI